MSSGRLLTGGTYEVPFTPAGNSLPQFGKRDFFIGAWNDYSLADWIVGAGGPENDDLTALLAVEDEGVLLAGSFFDSLYFAGEKLKTDELGYTVFVIHYNPATYQQWSYLLAGTGVRDIEALAVDTNGEYWALGNFGDDLILPDGTVLTAAGERDGLLLHLDADGNLIDYRVYPAAGRATGEQLLALPDGDIVIGGVFDDMVTIGSTTLTAETQDEDIFLASLDPQTLDPNWVRRLGAQFDDRLAKMVWHENAIVAVGQFLGVLQFDTGNLGEITTPGLNFDGFTATLQPDGTPTGLLGYGGAGDQFLTDARSDGDRLLVSGYFVPQITLADIQLNGAATGLTGFAASQTATGWGWATDLPGTDNTFIQQILAVSTDDVIVAGSFAGTATFDQESFTAQGDNEAFYALLERSLTPTVDLTAPVIRLWPNPATNRIYVSGICAQAQLSISTLTGQTHTPKRASDGSISLDGLPSGIYVLRIEDCGLPVLRRFVKH